MEHNRFALTATELNVAEMTGLIEEHAHIVSKMRWAMEIMHNLLDSCHQEKIQNLVRHYDETTMRAHERSTTWDAMLQRFYRFVNFRSAAMLTRPADPTDIDQVLTEYNRHAARAIVITDRLPTVIEHLRVAFAQSQRKRRFSD